MQMKYFDKIDEFKAGLSYGIGTVFINDCTKKSDFMFNDWRIPTVRSISENCVSAMSLALGGGSDQKNGDDYVEELLNFVRSKLASKDHSSISSFFMAVYFESNMLEPFSLNFSKLADMKRFSAIESNFSASGQRFAFSANESNHLFTKIESVVPNVSCFKLCFREVSEESGEQSHNYPYERIFEETLIFANLAVPRKK